MSRELDISHLQPKPELDDEETSSLLYLRINENQLASTVEATIPGKKHLPPRLKIPGEQVKPLSKRQIWSIKAWYLAFFLVVARNLSEDLRDTSDSVGDERWQQQIKEVHDMVRVSSDRGLKLAELVSSAEEVD